MLDLNKIFLVTQYAYNSDEELYAVTQYAFYTRDGADMHIEQVLSRGTTLFEATSYEDLTNQYVRHVDKVTGDAQYLRYCVFSLPDIPGTRYYLTLTVVDIE